MGKVNFLLAISFLLVTASAFTAGFTGGLIPHMYTGRHSTTSFGSDYLVNFETDNRVDVFDATEDIFAATCNYFLI